VPAHAALLGPSGVIVPGLRLASTPWTRFRGLIGTRELRGDEGLVLEPCRQVHTFGMRYPIDAVFCDASGVVVHVQTLRPRTFTRVVRRARRCIELSAGRAAEAGVTVGTRLSIEVAPGVGR
jgi:uncharacterized membrane protein (UPF0127 family)